MVLTCSFFATSSQVLDKEDIVEDNDENHNYAYFMHFQHAINVY